MLLLRCSYSVVPIKSSSAHSLSRLPKTCEVKGNTKMSHEFRGAGPNTIYTYIRAGKLHRGECYRVFSPTKIPSSFCNILLSASCLRVMRILAITSPGLKGIDCGSNLGYIGGYTNCTVIVYKHFPHQSNLPLIETLYNSPKSLYPPPNILMNRQQRNRLHTFLVFEIVRMLYDGRLFWLKHPNICQ